MNDSQSRMIRHWADCPNYPPQGATPPAPDQEILVPGSNQTERYILKRDTYRSQVAGFVQEVDTVSLKFIVPWSIMRRAPDKPLYVTLHQPLSSFGIVSHDEYRQALVAAVRGRLEPFRGLAASQPLMYDYFTMMLKETKLFLEKLPPYFFNAAFVESLRAADDSTATIPQHEYPGDSSRWAFDVTRYANQSNILRIDVKAPAPHQFTCISLIPVGPIPPRHQPPVMTRRKHAIRHIDFYIRALRDNNTSGQYVA